jgi:hypothetical protein
MATFSFTNAVPDEGIMFVFGSWVCVADGAGDFHLHLVNEKPEDPEATIRSDLDESIDKLSEMLLPNPAREIEEQFVLDATSNHAAPGLLKSDLIRSEDLHTRFLFALHNSATVYQEATRFGSLSTLDGDFHRLLKIGDEDTTACREAPIFDKYSDSDNDSKPFTDSHLSLMITTTP